MSSEDQIARARDLIKYGLTDWKILPMRGDDGQPDGLYQVHDGNGRLIGYDLEEATAAALLISLHQADDSQQSHTEGRHAMKLFDSALNNRQLGSHGLAAKVVRSQTTNPGWNPRELVQITLGLEVSEIGEGIGRMNSDDQATVLESIADCWDTGGSTLPGDMQMAHVWDSLVLHERADDVMAWLERLVAMGKAADEAAN